MWIDCKINLIFTSNICWCQKTPFFFHLLLSLPFPHTFFLPYVAACRTPDSVTGQDQWHLTPATLLLTPKPPPVLKVAGGARRAAAFLSSHWSEGGKREDQTKGCLALQQARNTFSASGRCLCYSFFFFASSGISVKILQMYNLMGKGGWLREVVVKSITMERSMWGKRRRAPFQTQSNEHDFALFCKTMYLFFHHF